MLSLDWLSREPERAASPLPNSRVTALSLHTTTPAFMLIPGLELQSSLLYGEQLTELSPQTLSCGFLFLSLLESFFLLGYSNTFLNQMPASRVWKETKSKMVFFFLLKRIKKKVNLETSHNILHSFLPVLEVQFR